MSSKPWGSQFLLELMNEHLGCRCGLETQPAPRRGRGEAEATARPLTRLGPLAWSVPSTDSRRHPSGWRVAGRAGPASGSEHSASLPRTCLAVPCPLGRRGHASPTTAAWQTLQRTAVSSHGHSEGKAFNPGGGRNLRSAPRAHTDCCLTRSLQTGLYNERDCAGITTPPGKTHLG